MLQIATMSDKANWAPSEGHNFCWYYIDLTDSAGNGVVVIWSVGLPFLSGSRQDLGGRRPALHIATYTANRPHRYLLQEFSPESVEFDPRSGNATFGRSVFRVTHTPTETRTEATLDIDLPEQTTWSGQVVVRGLPPRLALPTKPGAHSHHLWTPLAPHAEGEAELRSGEEVFRIRGDAYLDSNLSRTPLHDQGIRRWDWGRVRFQGKTLIYYLLEGDSDEERPDSSYVLLATDDGSLEPLRATVARDSYSISRYGVRSPKRLKFDCSGGFFEVQLPSRVDSSPFYERYLARGVDQKGLPGFGVAECVLPPRIDRPWMRPFIRMKTHHLSGPNSMWLPLFAGATGTPLGRLWRSFWTRHVS